jgi:hypothetical protein
MGRAAPSLTLLARLRWGGLLGRRGDSAVGVARLSLLNLDRTSRRVQHQPPGSRATQRLDRGEIASYARAHILTSTLIAKSTALKEFVEAERKWPAIASVWMVHRWRQTS